jgi:hypothetical protein
MLRRSLAFCAALSSLAGNAALAGDNDFRLNARRNGEGILFSGNAPRSDGWTRLTTELAYVVSPRLASPAETLGHAGFHVSALWSGTVVSSGDGFWDVTDVAQSRGAANGMLHTLQLDVRKGLPFSIELGVNLVWLVESTMMAPGLEVRWAISEGYAIAPDFGVRGSVSHLIGARDLNLTVVGIDAVVSKGFGIGGMVHLAPYLSWSVLMVAASSRVIDPTPTEERDFGDNFVFPELVATDNVHHKLTLGARALFYVLNLSLQGEFEMLEETPTGTDFFGSVATIGFKLGLDY